MSGRELLAKIIDPRSLFCINCRTPRLTMEIKVQCECGTKFKFDVEPVHGRMPVPVACPECATDATASANQFISQNMAATISPANYPAAAVGVSAPRAAVAVAAPAAP